MASSFSSRLPRWLVVPVALLLALGHACELPAVADLLGHVLSHTRDTAHEASHSHSPDGNEESCEAVAGVRASSHPSHHVGSALSITGGPVLVTVVSVRLGAAAPSESSGPPRRLPLFLLHASFLI